MKCRYDFQLGSDAGILCDDTGIIENPLINIFSGAYITSNTVKLYWISFMQTL